MGPHHIHCSLGLSVFIDTSSRVYFSFSNRCGTPAKSTPLWGLASLLAHRLVSTPLRRRAITFLPPIDMGPRQIHPSLGLSVFTSTPSCVYPVRGRVRTFLPLVDVGPSPNLPLFGAQHLYWHTVSCLPSFEEE